MARMRGSIDSQESVSSHGRRSPFASQVMIRDNVTQLPTAYARYGRRQARGFGTKWHIYTVHYRASEVRDVGAVTATGGAPGLRAGTHGSLFCRLMEIYYFVYKICKN
ncbi:unnamed protein product [Colias eurytheme]|nr:unnamed protein product [Colias eurytheme]